MIQQTIVVIDGGGRGAALVHKYSKSPFIGKILAIPGNDLMQANCDIPVVTFQNLTTTSIQEIIEICTKENVSLVDVAQDNAVAAGLVDELRKKGIPVVGPTKSAGEIEWNKAFSRDFMKQYGIPQPEYVVCHSIDEGYAYLDKQKDQPWFVKASGLCEGKGALPANNNTQAKKRISELQKFGESAKVFLLEKWLQSNDNVPAEEFSAFAIADGKNYRLIGYAQDHKRVFNNDKGENTGGMGCSTPPLVITSDIETQVNMIFKKTIDGLQKEGRPYTGILYLGGIIIDHKVFVIEFNARWGDPEAEVLVPGISDDLFAVSQAVAKGNIDQYFVSKDKKARVAVAGASKGYPGDYSLVKGKEITGLENARIVPGVTIYGAGIILKDGKYYANGGRLFYIVGEGNNVNEARNNAYTAMKMINIEGGNLHFRTDIGWRDVERIENGIKMNS